MKILGIQNNTAFKGINIDRNIRQIDMKKIIKPCMDSLKDISNGYNINSKSTSVLMHGKNHVSPRPAIDITITPKNESDAYICISKQTMPIRDYETDSETLFDIIKSTIRNIF